MRPYLTLAGFTRRSAIAPSDVDVVERQWPGFTAEAILVEQEALNARLQKRYNVYALPFGTTMGVPTADGTTPPMVVYGGPPSYGSPVSGDLQMILSGFTLGMVGVSTFNWSQDGGQTFTNAVLTAPAPGGVLLGNTGLTVLFPPGASFSTNNVYKSATPVPRKILQWLVDLVSLTVYRRRGMQATNDEMLKQYEKAADRALAESEEAANAKDGLFDLPMNNDSGGSAVVAPAPLAYGMSSPYEWMDWQRRRGRREDRRGGPFGMGNR